MIVGVGVGLGYVGRIGICGLGGVAAVIRSYRYFINKDSEGWQLASVENCKGAMVGFRGEAYSAG
jgi:hypothetical protein